MARNLTVELKQIESSERNGLHRVSAGVRSEPLWFETADCPLTCSTEAFASALLFPAIVQEATLLIRRPIDPVWTSNVRNLVRAWQEWWNSPLLFPQYEKFALSPSVPQPQEALCFSAGVDSFHTLLTSPKIPKYLVFVHGYDVPLADEGRSSACIRSLHRVAEDVGAKAIVIRTNLRLHSIYRGISWERSHGGALACVGHLLASQIGRLIISSGFPFWYPYAWGTHPRTDHWWSSSGLRIDHRGASRSRIDKVREISKHPLVRTHLRVCWKNRPGMLNCSRCDKCLCTMVLLDGCDALRESSVFDGSDLLVKRLNHLPSTRFVRTYQEFLAQDVRKEVRDSLRKLLERTAAPQRLSFQRWLQPFRLLKAIRRFRSSWPRQAVR